MELTSDRVQFGLFPEWEKKNPTLLYVVRLNACTSSMAPFFVFGDTEALASPLFHYEFYYHVCPKYVWKENM